LETRPRWARAHHWWAVFQRDRCLRAGEEPVLVTDILVEPEHQVVKIVAVEALNGVVILAVERAGRRNVRFGKAAEELKRSLRQTSRFNRLFRRTENWGTRDLPRQPPSFLVQNPVQDGHTLRRRTGIVKRFEVSVHIRELSVG